MKTRPDADIVRIAYNLLLDREPEDEAVIGRHLQHAPTLQDLRVRFITSNEFLKSNAKFVLRALARREGAMKMGPVQIKGTQEQLAALYRHIARVWSDLARDQPYYSVSSVPKYRTTSDGEMKELEAFYRSGAVETAELCEELEIHGVALSGATLVEYGCGAGRVTRHLAKRVHALHGFDLAPAYLQMTEECLAEDGTDNVTLHKVKTLEELEIPPCDLVYSRIVLQHNPPPVQLVLLMRLLQALRPGGTAVIQLPTGIDGYSFTIDDYLEQTDDIDDQELHVVPRPAVFKVAAECGCEVLDVRRDGSLSNVDAISTRFLFRKS